VAVIAPQLRAGSGMTANAADGLLWALQHMKANWQQRHLFASVSVDLTSVRTPPIVPDSYAAFEKVLKAATNRFWTSWTTVRAADTARAPSAADRLRGPVSIVFVVVPKLPPTQRTTFNANVRRAMNAFLSKGDGATPRIVVAHHRGLAEFDEKLLRAALVGIGDRHLSKVLVEEDESARARTGLLSAIEAIAPPSEVSWEGLIELHKRIGALPIVPKQHLTLPHEWVNIAVSFIMQPVLMRIVDGP
jgi:hypothetical protein